MLVILSIGKKGGLEVGLWSQLPIHDCTRVIHWLAEHPCTAYFIINLSDPFLHIPNMLLGLSRTLSQKLGNFICVGRGVFDMVWIFFFQDRVSLHNPGSLGTQHVAQAGPSTPGNLLAFISQVLGF